ncbi:MAG: efflux RND transporter periplasmic adaptor subunit [Hydrogenibacillus schlegelii]|uniref:Efflux RND transporter periplasmic adaptor subunit n=1 Tax=Hydrogenibacillus schlegelii TaxID=1484 RepID=A0A947GAL8_HYDSH|nr:efflux RND transporter periplasmic adaptor subunit [Hydrogenibacillus schlegelii]MBT9282985.1 efflux RND transporter periplasmic adaptor subunit [Hydrogenibacillus schlegelii]
MRRRRVLGVILVLFLLLGGAGAYGVRVWSEGQKYIITDDAQVKGKPIPVSAPASGKLVDWKAKVGETVDKDVILGEVELPPGPTGAGVTVPVVMPERATIVSDSAVPGTMVGAGMPLAEAFDFDDLWIEAMVKESDLAAVKIGSRAEVTVDAFPGRTFVGRVAEIGLYTADVFSLLPDTNRTSGNYTKVEKRIPVKIRLDGKPDVRLIPGLNAAVRIAR